uniref:Uncharacterized protein n=1 Tax=Molossus molossus TaxID=27622 RepID=A0A7J8FZ09_MOLMO|nr:hypothetical protein HJG59_008229 [Molossus molossus]
MTGQAGQDSSKTFYPLCALLQMKHWSWLCDFFALTQHKISLPLTSILLCCFEYAGKFQGHRCLESSRGHCLTPAHSPASCFQNNLSSPFPPLIPPSPPLPTLSPALLCMSIVHAYKFCGLSLPHHPLFWGLSVCTPLPRLWDHPIPQTVVFITFHK